MISKRHNAANRPPPRRKLSLTVGDVLFDLRGHAYRVISLDETSSVDDRHPAAAIGVVPVNEEGDRERAGLTRRQLQIARLLANRATNAEIAASLGISVHTARHHSQRVLEKLGITSRAQVRTRIGRPTGEQRGVTDGGRER